MEVDNLLADAEKLTGGKVTVEGVCTHICRHGGRKIFLMGTDDTQVIRIEAGERIADFRARIADRKAKEGKEYLSFYHVDGGSYEVLK